jgi:hypothetical protein
MATQELAMQAGSTPRHNHHLELPESGRLRKMLWQDEHCQHTLFCLAAGTEIAAHTATRNTTVQAL